MSIVPKDSLRSPPSPAAPVAAVSRLGVHMAASARDWPLPAAALTWYAAVGAHLADSSPPRSPSPTLALALPQRVVDVPSAETSAGEESWDSEDEDSQNPRDEKQEQAEAFRAYLHACADELVTLEARRRAEFDAERAVRIADRASLLEQCADPHEHFYDYIRRAKMTIRWAFYIVPLCLLLHIFVEAYLGSHRSIDYVAMVVLQAMLLMFHLSVKAVTAFVASRQLNDTCGVCNKAFPSIDELAADPARVVSLPCCGHRCCRECIWRASRLCPCEH